MFLSAPGASRPFLAEASDLTDVGLATLMAYAAAPKQGNLGRNAAFARG